MADRWPARMSRATAAEYLDMSVRQLDKIATVHRLPRVQMVERGEFGYRKADLDEMLERLARQDVIK